MKRFDKTKMSIHSQEYNDLLTEEINVWSRYHNSEGDISSFDKLKETHIYQTYRKGTVELELNYIKNLGENISVLELGSADGWLSNEILSLGKIKNITSIDISLEKNIEEYDKKIITIKGDLNKIDEISFPQNFDCIITHGTLHHLVYPRKVLEYCLDNLLNKDGLLIINDTWILKSLQLKTNALFYLILNRLPHSIIELDIKEFMNLLFIKIPKTAFSKSFAASIAHSHKTSPFESISSADDYKDLYERSDLKILHFQTVAALPGLQNSWMKSPKIIKNIIQKMDSFLIKNKIFPGDLHICVIKKIK